MSENLILELSKIFQKHKPKFRFFSLLLIAGAIFTFPKNINFLFMEKAIGYVLKSEEITGNVDKLYTYQIKYGFRVQKKRYVGEKIFHNPAHPLKKKFPKGKKISVYYDGDNPNYNLIDVNFRSILSNLFIISVGASVLTYSFMKK